MRTFLSPLKLHQQIIMLGIETTFQYRIEQKKHDDWPTCFSFEQWKEEFDAAGIKSSTEYIQKYTNHPGWPASPQKVYSQHFSSWPKFLGKENERCGIRYSISFEEWKVKIKLLGITVSNYSNQYRQLAKLDRELPTNPNIVFKSKWKGWWDVFGLQSKEEMRKKKYLSFLELKALIKEKGINSPIEYWAFAKNNKGIGFPSYPQVVYQEWSSWPSFFGRPPLSFEELQAEVRAKGIQSFPHYSDERKNNLRWPYYPPSSFKEKWVSWMDFLGVPKPRRGTKLMETLRMHIFLKKLQSELENSNLTSLVDYTLLRKQTNNEMRWPAHPVEYYGLKNLFEFIGFSSKEEMLVARRAKRRKKSSTRQEVPALSNLFLELVKKALPAF